MHFYDIFGHFWRFLNVDNHLLATLPVSQSTPSPGEQSLWVCSSLSNSCTDLINSLKQNVYQVATKDSGVATPTGKADESKIQYTSGSIWTKRGVTTKQLFLVSMMKRFLADEKLVWKWRWTRFFGLGYGLGLLSILNISFTTFNLKFYFETFLKFSYCSSVDTLLHLLVIIQKGSLEIYHFMI